MIVEAEMILIKNARVMDPEMRIRSGNRYFIRREEDQTDR